MATERFDSWLYSELWEGLILQGLSYWVLLVYVANSLLKRLILIERGLHDGKIQKSTGRFSFLPRYNVFNRNSGCLTHQCLFCLALTLGGCHPKHLIDLLAVPLDIAHCFESHVLFEGLAQLGDLGKAFLLRCLLIFILCLLVQQHSVIKRLLCGILLKVETVQSVRCRADLTVP
jgi:hypothetical protein